MVTRSHSGTIQPKSYKNLFATVIPLPTSHKTALQIPQWFDSMKEDTTFLSRLIWSLSSEFAITDLGPLHYFFGISVTRTAVGLHLSQEKYANDILERAAMLSCNPYKTPVDTNSKLASDISDPISDPTGYRSIAGALYYAVQQICLHMHDPRVAHLKTMKRILRYVTGTTSLGLTITSGSVSQLIAYSNADWAGCPDSRCSTLGYCVFLGPNLVSWSSKRHSIVSRSSVEAEYSAVANAIAEACWLRILLKELSSPLTSATVVFCDNVSAVYMSTNLIQHQRTKHIEIDIHFVREKGRFGRGKGSTCSYHSSVS
ncbi:hypothetical protein V2J09_004269 [Rumex salicifolius]